MQSKLTEPTQQNATDNTSADPIQQQRAPYNAPQLERLDVTATKFSGGIGGDGPSSSAS
jgi:hypothetical protein